MQKRNPWKCLLLLPLSLGFFSCDAETDSRPVITASFYPLSYLASRIGGDQVRVVTLTAPGAEPHESELTASNLRDMTKAKLILTNGLSMEPWLESLTPSLKEKTVRLGDFVDTQTIEGRIDPHVWLDTTNYRKMAAVTLNRLNQALPEYKASFEANHAAFLSDLALLETECRRIATSFPTGKTIAVSHAAYGYLCHEWGIEQLYISKLSPDEEPTQEGIAAIMDAVKTKGIDTIFFEELASDRVARYIAEKTGAKVESLNPLEGLTSEEREAGEDYFSIYRDNMKKIAEAKP